MTTVATPHRGTRLCDAALGLLSAVPKGGLFDCDGKVPNDPTRLDVANPMFVPIAPLLAGPLNHSNDGLVTVDSARWGTFIQCVPADHLKEVGVLSASQQQPVSGFEHREFFRSIVGRVRAAGF